MDLQLLRWQPETCALAAPSSGLVTSAPAKHAKNPKFARKSDSVRTEKRKKKKKKLFCTVGVLHSGWLRVACGCCGDRATSLARARAMPTRSWCASILVLSVSLHCLDVCIHRKNKPDSMGKRGVGTTYCHRWRVRTMSQVTCEGSCQMSVTFDYDSLQYHRLPIFRPWTFVHSSHDRRTLPHARAWLTTYCVEWHK